MGSVIASMDTKLLDILFLFSLLYFEAAASNLTTCDKISIQCAPLYYHINIKAVNATPTLFMSVLEGCNGNHECFVQNPNSECVHVGYWCRMNFTMLEIKTSSLTKFRSKVSSPLLGLTSEAYLMGKYQDAENIECNLTDSARKYHEEIHWIVNEFSSLTNTTLCLSMRNSSQPLFCFGSGTKNGEYGPFNMTKEYQFNIKLASTVTEVPRIRFWIDMKGHKSANYRLKCLSHAVEIKSKPSKNLGMTFKISTLLSLVVIMVGMIMGFIFRPCKWYNKQPEDQSEVQQEQQQEELAQQPEQQLEQQLPHRHMVNNFYCDVGISNADDMPRAQQNVRMTETSSSKSHAWKYEEDAEFPYDMEVADNPDYDSHDGAMFSDIYAQINK